MEDNRIPQFQILTGFQLVSHRSRSWDLSLERGRVRTVHSRFQEFAKGNIRFEHLAFRRVITSRVCDTRERKSRIKRSDSRDRVPITWKCGCGRAHRRSPEW